LLGISAIELNNNPATLTIKKAERTLVKGRHPEHPSTTAKSNSWFSRDVCENIFFLLYFGMVRTLVLTGPNILNPTANWTRTGNTDFIRLFLQPVNE